MSTRGRAGIPIAPVRTGGGVNMASTIRALDEQLEFAELNRS
jgi:hypothetical protein